MNYWRNDTQGSSNRMFFSWRLRLPPWRCRQIWNTFCCIKISDSLEGFGFMFISTNLNEKIFLWVQRFKFSEFARQETSSNPFICWWGLSCRTLPVDCSIWFFCKRIFVTLHKVSFLFLHYKSENSAHFQLWLYSFINLFLLLYSIISCYHK